MFTVKLAKLVLVYVEYQHKKCWKWSETYKRFKTFHFWHSHSLNSFNLRNTIDSFSNGALGRLCCMLHMNAFPSIFH